MLPRRPLIAVASIALMFTACAEPPGLAPLSPTVSLTVVSGSGQSGVAGQELPLPLVVRVTRSNGRGVAGQVVNFKVTSGGGSVYAGTSVTDATGTAQEYWTLGPARGAQQVDVVAVDPSSGAKQNFGTFTATAVLPATLAIAPPSASFPNVAVGGTSAASTFTVTNSGDQTSGALAVSVTGPNASEFLLGPNSCTGVALAGGASCSVAVRMAPTALGARSATLTVAGTPGGSLSASLSGSGIQAPILTLSPATYNFGTIAAGVQTSSATFQIGNTGTLSATWIAVTLVDPGNAFQITSNICLGATIPVGPATCPVAVQYRPTVAGTHTATLQVTSTNGGSASATLTGQAVSPPALSITPASKAFGTVTLGSSSVQQFTVTNTGGSSSASLATNVQDLTGTNAFSVQNDQCIGAALAPTQTCTLELAFAPTVAGTANGQLLVEDGLVQATANLTGTGQSAAALLEGSATSFSFGAVTVGTSSATQDLLVTNIGLATSGTIAVALSGANAGDFAIVSDDCTASALTSGSDCTVSLQFAPTAGGSRSATLTVSASPGGSVQLSLAGSGVVPAMLTPSVTTLDFGTWPVSAGATGFRVIDITNTGNQVSAIVGITITGTHVTEFSIVLNTCSGRPLSPGQSCQVSLTFNPQFTGVRTATLEIAGGAVTSTVALTGTGS